MAHKKVMPLKSSKKREINKERERHTDGVKHRANEKQTEIDRKKENKCERER